MWQRKQYDNAALEIAKNYVAADGQCSIEDLATKVANDNNLNPDGIRTLVRLANVCAFQELFDKKAGDEDRMVEFKLGDAELVISKLHEDAREKVASAPAPTAPNYNRHLDYFGEFEKVANGDEEEEGEEVEELAEEELKEEQKADGPVVDKQKTKKLFEAATEKLEGEKKEAQYAWLRNMENAAQSVRVLSGTSSFGDMSTFEKDAVCSVGEDIIPELRALNYMVGGSLDAPLFGGEKIASVHNTHVVLPLTSEKKNVCTVLKNASQARYNSKECDRGLVLLRKGLSECQ